LKLCATRRKTASYGDSLSAYSFLPLYDPGVDSASKRNEYHGYLLGVKAAGA